MPRSKQDSKQKSIRLVLTLTEEQDRNITQFAQGLNLTRQQFVLYCVTTAMLNTRGLAEVAQVSLFDTPAEKMKKARTVK